jgi:hypothetical protein
MSKTQAELIISPEVSKSELDRSMKQIDKAIKKVAKNTEKELGGATKEGIEKGATAGGGMSFVKKLGLAGIATAIGAAVVQGFSIAAELVGGAEGVIGEMLGDKSATGALSFAAGQGITNAQFANLSGNVTRAGGDDQMVRDFVVDTSEYIAQAAAGENPLLSNFQGLEGTEQFNAVVASMSSMSVDERNKFLADIGWAGDAGVINSMIGNLDGATGKEAFKQLETVSREDERRAALIEREAALEKQFEDIQRETNIGIKEDQISALTPETLEAMGEAQKARAADELKNLLNYQDNLEAAEAARKFQQTLDDKMLQMATFFVDVFKPFFTQENALKVTRSPDKKAAIERATNQGTGSHQSENKDYSTNSLMMKP